MGSDFLTPVTRTTLTADISRKMVGHLLRGDWREGERIPAERELGLRLGVGRASLREALKALEIMGMIESRLGEGTFVCKRSDFLSRPLLWAIAGGSNESDSTELIEARKLIESELAGLAAERATPEDLAQIGSYLDIMEASRNDLPRFQEADVAFHLAIGSAGHNRILQNALHLIRNLMQRWVQNALQKPGVADEAFEQHKQVFLTIAKRNPSKARDSMRTHIDMMASHLVHPDEQDQNAPAAAQSTD